MPKRIEDIDPKLADKVWEMAGRIEWTAEDWGTFYFAITKAFLEIVGRHAKRKILEMQNSERINVDANSSR